VEAERLMSSSGVIDRAIAEVRSQGYCVLRNHLPSSLVDACREGFWPRLRAYLAKDPPSNRGPHRHFLPMPFAPPCFAPQFFFDADILAITCGLMDDHIVADQWGCDVPVAGSEYQEAHVDYWRPLYPEEPGLLLPPFAILIGFGLTRIGREHGPIEIAPGTHRMPRASALHAVNAGAIGMESVPMEIGDVLIRHPWALHRGTPNTTDTPRVLVTIRFARRWYADASREVELVPRAVWESLTPTQQRLMRFPVDQSSASHV
jgi:hypothetical protein